MELQTRDYFHKVPKATFEIWKRRKNSSPHQQFRSPDSDGVGIVRLSSRIRSFQARTRRSILFYNFSCIYSRFYRKLSKIPARTFVILIGSSDKINAVRKI